MKFQDARTTLPRHATKTFARRTTDAIRGGVLHHTAGSDDPVATARYHVGPNHISETGCPALLYTFFVRHSGEIYWANDLEDITWSQGGHGSPVPGTDPNANFLAIVMGGDFSSATHVGADLGPTFLQIHATLSLWGHLTGAEKSSVLPESLFDVLDCPVESLYGHHKFGKPECPGVVMASVTDSVRSYLAEESGEGLETTKDWQEALITLGYDLDPWGADGDWGSQSRSALASFQRDHDLTVDGIRGPLSETTILNALDAQNS